MTAKSIPHTDLGRLLARLQERGTVRAPARDEAGEAVLAEFARGKAVQLDYGNFRLSPKAFLLPQNLTLLTFDGGKAGEPALRDQEVFLFGVRPCDARALPVLDKVFLNGDQNDPYYARFRARTTVIALACARPAPQCFCTSVGGGPGDAAGADCLAVALESDLLMRAQTPKGEELLASVADLFADASTAAAKEAEDAVHAAENQIAPVELSDIAQRLSQSFDSPMWQAAGSKCLGCGTCSFLCPTCHCFDITDSGSGGKGRRIRTWDCCAYPLFTLHASGHNPRPAPAQRWRQRIMHKFRYAVETCDRFFCVGCGRCIRYCPVSMDVRTVLKEVGA